MNNIIDAAKEIVSSHIVYDLNFEIITSCNGIHLAHRIVHKTVKVRDVVTIKYEFALANHPKDDIFELGRLT